MNTRAFVLSLLAASLGAGGVVYWSNRGGDSVVVTEDVRGADGETAVREKRVVSDDVRVADAARRFAGLRDHSIRWQVRVDRLRRLDGGDLNDAEVDYLYSLLEYRPKSQHAEDWWVVVNEVMEQLRKQGLGREVYTEVMVGIIRDASAPEVLRDYAMQHLGIWVSPRDAVLGLPYEEDAGRVRVALEAIASVVDDVQLEKTSMPGTALKVLADAREGEVNEALVDEVFVRLEPWMERVISGDGGMDVVTRTSAVNVAGLLRLEKYLESIRNLVNEPGTNGSVRLSSIAALGAYGEEADRGRLKAIADSETKFRHAAVAALKRLEL